jgi:hypothetical protein
LSSGSAGFSPSPAPTAQTPTVRPTAITAL